MAITDVSACMAIDDRKFCEFFVPEWNDTVLLRSMTANERDLWEKKFTGNKIPDIVRAALVAKCFVDSNGTRLFSDEQASTLGEKSAAALDRLFDYCMKMNRFSKEDIEELTKKS